MVSEIMRKMIDYSDGSHHDINHFTKVWAHAKTIGELEGLDADTQNILEIAAIVHDIACPSLRARYGTANGKLQEIEGPPMARELLRDTGLTDAQIDRIAFLVGHHHTPAEADGPDYQILIEADYIVNADESSYSPENIRSTHDTIFKTASGKKMLESIFKLTV